jgi:hypothetical protein
LAVAPPGIAGTDTPPERVCGLYIFTGPDDLMIVSRSMNVHFTAADDPSASGGPGTVDEKFVTTVDGFPAAGSAAAKRHGGKRCYSGMTTTASIAFA